MSQAFQLEMPVTGLRIACCPVPAILQQDIYTLLWAAIDKSQGLLQIIWRKSGEGNDVSVPTYICSCPATYLGRYLL